MFNVAIKPTAILCATLLAGALSSCNNGKEAEAMALYEDAKALYDTHLYDSTLSVLDTLYKRYPAETDVIRQGIHLMAQAQEQISIAGIAQADSVIAANAPIVKKIAKDFVVVKNPDLVENYRIYKTLKNNPLINRTGFEPRVDDNGNIYLVSLLQGRAIKHTSLRVIAADGRSAETASVPYDDAQNYRFTTDGVSNEMVTMQRVLQIHCRQRHRATPAGVCRQKHIPHPFANIAQRGHIPIIYLFSCNTSRAESRG